MQRVDVPGNEPAAGLGSLPETSGAAGPPRRIANLVPRLGVALALLMGACSADDRSALAPTVRDSLGVRIIENHGRAWSAGPGWRVSPEPILSIGEADGSPEYLLSFVTAATLMDDGRVAVADGGSSSVRIYGPGGDHLVSSGGPGRGPGEYIDLRGIKHIAGDSLMVVDGLLQRISILDSNGVYARSFGLELVEGFYNTGPYNVVGPFDGGRVLASAASGRGFGEEDAGSVISDSIRFFLFDRDGRTGEFLAAFSGAQRWGLRIGTAVTFPYLPFSGGPVSAGGHDRVVLGSGVDPEILVFGIDGGLTSVIRWPADRRASRAELDRLRAVLLDPDRPPEQIRSNRQLLAEAPLPDSLPVARSAKTDPYGNVWVERYRVPGESQPEWDVFSAEGQWLGTLQTPDRLRIDEIGETYILGTWRDELNVEYVRVYALDRHGS